MSLIPCDKRIGRVVRCHAVQTHHALSPHVSDIREKCYSIWRSMYISVCLLPFSPLFTQCWLCLLTDEPCIGSQAGLVIVLVGTSAHSVRSHPAVHHVISQPRPAWQTQSTEQDRSVSQTCSRSTCIHTQTQIQITWPILGPIYSNYQSWCNICFRANRHFE